MACEKVIKSSRLKSLKDRLSQSEAEGRRRVWVTAAVQSDSDAHKERFPCAVEGYEARGGCEVGASSLNQHLQHLHSSSEATWQKSNWISDTIIKINSPQLQRHRTSVLGKHRSTLSQTVKKVKRWGKMKNSKSASACENCKGRRQRRDKGTATPALSRYYHPEAETFSQTPCWGVQCVHQWCVHINVQCISGSVCMSTAGEDKKIKKNKMNLIEEVTGQVVQRSSRSSRPSFVFLQREIWSRFRWN